MAEERSGPDPAIRTERLVLRRERAGDRAVWHRHMNTPAVMAHLGGPASEADVEASFARMAAADLPFLLVERVADGLLVGKCGLARIDTPAAPAVLSGEVQIGWTMRADCWGRGYAREAAQAMMAHAFGALGCERLWGQTSMANQPSWRLMERLGMRRRPDLDYEDPDYPPEENPTVVFGIGRGA